MKDNARNNELRKMSKILLPFPVKMLIVTGRPVASQKSVKGHDVQPGGHRIRAYLKEQLKKHVGGRKPAAGETNLCPLYIAVRGF